MIFTAKMVASALSSLRFPLRSKVRGTPCTLRVLLRVQARGTLPYAPVRRANGPADRLLNPTHPWRTPLAGRGFTNPRLFPDRPALATFVLCRGARGASHSRCAGGPAPTSLSGRSRLASSPLTPASRQSPGRTSRLPVRRFAAHPGTAQRTQSSSFHSPFFFFA
jgi:hypothetical protein